MGQTLNMEIVWYRDLKQEIETERFYWPNQGYGERKRENAHIELLESTHAMNTYDP